MATDSDQHQLIELIAPELEQVRRLIQAQVAGIGEELPHLLNMIKTGAGKMIRPSLVILSGKCFSEINDLHINAAAIAELIHTVTLLHDDVLDEAQVRRSLPSINNVYGNKAAVLGGDLIFAKVFELCSTAANARIISLFASTTSTLCIGEIRQNFARRNWHLSRDEYIRIIADKTASFFSACCVAGAMASNGKPEYISLLKQFGLNLGIAFQITDDILDLTASQSTTGKPAGSDIRNSIPTLPLIILIESAPENEKWKIVAKLSDDQTPLEEKLKIINSSDAVSKAHEYCAQYHRKALDLLEQLPPSPSRSALRDLADSLL